MTNSDPPLKSQHSNGGAPTLVLLDELITDILSRLPVKTLMQFKCVCKSWKTLISNPALAKLHLHRSPWNTHLAMVSNRSTSKDELDCSVVPFPVSRLLQDPLTIVPFCPSIRFRSVFHYSWILDDES
ncbi:F-box-like protein [Medicago truncatula]|uniref:F-box-like protein n=1 Tax=Medicago truncatula TaxID=3880 RepID=A0A072TZQ2_MEDTR|nr:F-box-like protein [Medicago truncatula]